MKAVPESNTDTWEGYLAAMLEAAAPFLATGPVESEVEAEQRGAERVFAALSVHFAAHPDFDRTLAEFDEKGWTKEGAADRESPPASNEGEARCPECGGTSCYQSSEGWYCSEDEGRCVEHGYWSMREPHGQCPQCGDLLIPLDSDKYDWDAERQRFVRKPSPAPDEVTVKRRDLSVGLTDPNALAGVRYSEYAQARRNLRAALADKEGKG
jgi:hypothetical protein